MNDNIRIGGRLATGDTDPRSTNQTTTSYFSTKNIRLDKAYAFWSASNSLEFKFGKYSKPFMIIDDLLWDSDITFEGISIGWVWDAEISPFLKGGGYILDETKSTGNDPQMYCIQPGISFGSGRVGVETSLMVHIFEHVKGSSPDEDISTGTNTRVDGKLKYDYDSINPLVVVTYSPETVTGAQFAVKVKGNYIYSFDSGDIGYLLGLVLGNPKVKAAGSWQVYYNYRHLERDAWLDVFPDSDFYGGATNASGHEVIAYYGIAKNVALGVDYYHAGAIQGDREPEDLVQFDCIFKF
jgi:hypothetical protein